MHVRAFHCGVVEYAGVEGACCVAAVVVAVLLVVEEGEFESCSTFSFLAAGPKL